MIRKDYIKKEYVTMIRKIIKIDESKCNGCGLCAEACHEGAIGMVGGKAKLLRDDYCDGLGDCLPVCPTDAITFEEREAAEYDRAAVEANMAAADRAHAGGCPGSAARAISHDGCPGSAAKSIAQENNDSGSLPGIPSHLSQWPVQIKLAPLNAPYFDGADLLIAADCSAFAYGDFHRDFIKDRIVLIGCPKLDSVDYSEKLTAILQSNDIRSVTVTRMEVPCCGGIQFAAESAVAASGKDIPVNVVTIGIDGSIK